MLVSRCSDSVGTRNRTAWRWRLNQTWLTASRGRSHGLIADPSLRERLASVLARKDNAPTASSKGGRFPSSRWSVTHRSASGNGSRYPSARTLQVVAFKDAVPTFAHVYAECSLVVLVGLAAGASDEWRDSPHPCAALQIDFKPLTVFTGEERVGLGVADDFPFGWIPIQFAPQSHRDVGKMTDFQHPVVRPDVRDRLFA